MRAAGAVDGVHSSGLRSNAVPARRARAGVASGAMKGAVWASLAFVLLIASFATVFAQFPKPSGYVNDFAGIISAPTRDELEALLRNLEQDTTAEVAVVTVN